MDHNDDNGEVPSRKTAESALGRGDANNKRIIKLHEELERVKLIANEVAYELRNQQHKILLSAELTKLYTEKLLRDGDVTKAEQLEIFEKMRKSALYTIEAVNQATGVMEQSEGR